MSKSFVDPVAEEAEHRIITICCNYPKRIDLVDAVSDDFHSLKWRAVWEALTELRGENGEQLDALTVMDRVVDRVPRIQYSDLATLDGDPFLIERYSDIVRESAQKRRLRLGLSEVLFDLENGSSADSAISQASKVLSSATLGQPEQGEDIGDLAKRRILELAEMAEAVKNGNPAISGVPTGIDRLDEIIGGWQIGIPNVVAGRPSMGKSALVLNSAIAASEAGHGVHIFTLEDNWRTYVDRALSNQGKLPADRIRDVQNYNRGTMFAVQQAASKLHAIKGWKVDDRAGVTAEEIINSVRRRAEKNKTKLVIVDYMQLLKRGRNESTQEMLTESIYRFGEAAKEDSMAYVLLSQLNRSLESREDKRPLMSDLKGCGALEERAKVVVMAYRPYVYQETYKPGQYMGQEIAGQVTGKAIPESVMEVLVRKNSNGRVGTVLADWSPDEMSVK